MSFSFVMDGFKILFKYRVFELIPLIKIRIDFAYVETIGST
mgnify:CR=1 FL=1